MLRERRRFLGDMDIGQLCSILAACMSTNPEQRKAGEATLEQVQPLITDSSMPVHLPQGAKMRETGL